jgi:HPt (histidine-containing phosphotransfer) domain-containing protein
MKMPEAPTIENVHYDINSPIMDREQIDMLLMSDDGDPQTSLARELFHLFVNESSAKLEPLPEVCATGDLLQLRNMVHFVAGSAGNLGLARLAAFYRAIERAIDQGRLTDISDVEAPIRHEFGYAREAFRADFSL